MRVTKNEITSTVEMFVNSIYDEGDQSMWKTATEDEWVMAVYGELTNWKTVEIGTFVFSTKSNENRFDGADEILARIRPVVKARINRLRREGLVK